MAEAKSTVKLNPCCPLVKNIQRAPREVMCFLSFIQLCVSFIGEGGGIVTHLLSTPNKPWRNSPALNALCSPSLNKLPLLS